MELWEESLVLSTKHHARFAAALTSSPCDFGLTQSITNQTMLSFTQNAVAIGRSNNLHSSQSTKNRNDSFNKVGSLASSHERYWSSANQAYQRVATDTKVLDRELSLTFLSASKGRWISPLSIPIHHLGSITCWANILSLGLRKHWIFPMPTRRHSRPRCYKSVRFWEMGSLSPHRFRIELKPRKTRIWISKSSLGVIECRYDWKVSIGQKLLEPGWTEILHQSRTTPFVGDDANLLLTFVSYHVKPTTHWIWNDWCSLTWRHTWPWTARNGPQSQWLWSSGASKRLKYDYDEVSEEGHFIVNVGGKCIVILEKDESFSFIRRMKPLMSGDDDELVWKTPIKNELHRWNWNKRFHHSWSSFLHHPHDEKSKRSRAITRQSLMTRTQHTTKWKRLFQARCSPKRDRTSQNPWRLWTASSIYVGTQAISYETYSHHWWLTSSHLGTLNISVILEKSCQS